MSSLSGQDMTRGSLAKQILTFSLPLICSNLLQVLFNLADLAVVGQFVGATALGSVGSTTTLVTMFTGFLIGLAAASTFWPPGFTAPGTTSALESSCTPPPF